MHTPRGKSRKKCTDVVGWMSFRFLGSLRNRYTDSVSAQSLASSSRLRWQRPQAHHRPATTRPTKAEVPTACSVVSGVSVDCMVGGGPTNTHLLISKMWQVQWSLIIINSLSKFTLIEAVNIGITRTIHRTRGCGGVGLKNKSQNSQKDEGWKAGV